MKKVKFSDIFSIEYVDIIVKYRDRIQKLLSTYDILIFMARKAICFYKAMVANNEVVPNENCVVLSSRVLSYNVIRKYKGKRIALIDDVVVKGKSILYSKEILEDNNINVDIHFVACEKEIIEKNNLIDCIKSPFIYLSDTSIYQLSNYITEYIEASMIPYNVDQPIYSIRFKNLDEFDDLFLNRNQISDITDGLQKKYGIKNMSVHFDPSFLISIFGNDFEVENAYLKIRFLHYVDSLELVAIPFVLLPEISYNKLDEVFFRLFGNILNKYIFHCNKREEYENKLKVLQYVLSDVLFNNFSRMIGFHSTKKDKDNEYMQYAIEFDEKIITRVQSIPLNKSYCDQINGFESYFLFDSLLSDTYDYIFDSINSNEYFYNAKGEKQNQRIITFSGLITYIKRSENSFEKYAVSSIIDILIDKGILIPSIVHNVNNGIVRGYKCGEIFNLTKKGIDLFAYMLDEYVDLNKGKPLGKVELEKLCVLFFKNAAYKHRLFSTVKTFDDDCFSICYSKFGPRVSNCNKKYKVESNSALARVLDESGKIYLENDKYKVSVVSAPTDEKWGFLAKNFALSYFHLFKCFENKTIRYKYVHTYNDFLTLLSIGPDRKNKMFSLMAELYLMMRIEIKGSLSNILYEMNHYSSIRQTNDKPIYQGIMDGIGSGMWKYSCFCEADLMDSVFIAAGKEQSDVRFIKEDYLSSVDESDENPVYLELIDKCGYLLYEIAYLFNYAQKRISKNETNKIFNKAVFYNTKFKSMRHEIKKKCEECSDEEIIKDFNILRKRALALINQCDLCIEDAALNSIKICNDMWVLFHPKSSLKKFGLEINMHSSKDNDLIRKCIFLQYNQDKSFEFQLNELIDRYAILDTKALLLFVNIENFYEGIFENYHTATGDYFKELIRQLIIKSNYKFEMSANKVVICTRKEQKNREYIYFENYILKFDCCGEVLDGYKFLQYILIKREVHSMGNSDSRQINFNAPIIVNGGVVGTIGSENTVNNIHIEDFYKDIEKMNTEALNNDPSTMKLSREIKEEAKNKNYKGVLEKLKKLATSVGSSVFAKVVSTLIIDVMKANGYFPF